MDAIIKLMAKEGLTQKSLGAIIGKTQPTVNSFLKGKTNLQPEDAAILIKKFPKDLSWESIYGQIKKGHSLSRGNSK